MLRNLPEPLERHDITVTLPVGMMVHVHGILVYLQESVTVWAETGSLAVMLSEIVRSGPKTSDAQVSPEFPYRSGLNQA